LTSKKTTPHLYKQQPFYFYFFVSKENDEPCPITCNGDSPTAWSKTMIGTVTEDEGYALEVTYNYGVEKYPTGTGLTSFYVMVNSSV
jgi:hypothetical protein